MRRETVCFLTRFELPYAIGAVCVSRLATQQCRPEHEALYLLAARFLDAFIANLTNQYRHGWARGQRLVQRLDRVGHALAVAVACLQHVEVEHRWVVHAES